MKTREEVFPVPDSLQICHNSVGSLPTPAEPQDITFKTSGALPPLPLEKALTPRPNFLESGGPEHQLCIANSLKQYSDRLVGLANPGPTDNFLADEIKKLKEASEEEEHAMLNRRLKELEQSWRERVLLKPRLEKLETLELENARLKNDLQKEYEREMQASFEPSKSLMMEWVRLDRSIEAQMSELNQMIVAEQEEQRRINERIDQIQSENTSLMRNMYSRTPASVSTLSKTSNKLNTMVPKQVLSDIFERPESSRLSKGEREVPFSKRIDGSLTFPRRA